MTDNISKQILKTCHREPMPDVTIRWPGLVSWCQLLSYSVTWQLTLLVFFIYLEVIPAVVQLLLWNKDAGVRVRAQSPTSPLSDTDDVGPPPSLCERISLLVLTDLTLLTASNQNNCRYH